ncbi:hypothetical protein JCGZ_02336 [Jatropha curcas]|uniref:Uncharacterized protein n=1 Tax=Jatropha curcas TaxID=180498 RepID=A0A067KZE6_JATCU|nr:hypothetical protein JCGZ_02336 [Jatropha curcas]
MPLISLLGDLNLRLVSLSLKSAAAPLEDAMKALSTYHSKLMKMPKLTNQQVKSQQSGLCQRKCSKSVPSFKGRR